MGFTIGNLSDERDKKHVTVKQDEGKLLLGTGYIGGNV